MTANASIQNVAVSANESKPRRSFKVCEDARTLKSSIAYLDASIDQFIAMNEHVIAASVNVAHCKVNDKLELIVSDTRAYKPVHLSINSTCALDWRKIDEAYSKRIDKIIERQRVNGGKACKPARKSGPTKAELAQQVAELQAQFDALYK